MKIVQEFISLNENVQQAKSILKKNNLPETYDDYLFLKDMLEKDNKLGYLGPFTKWLIEQRTPLEQLKELFDVIKNSPIKVPPIQQFNTAENMYDEIRRLESSSKINSLIKYIPSNARKILDTPQLRDFILDNIKYWEQLKSYFLSVSGGYVNNPNRNPKDFIPDLETYLQNLKGEWNLQTTLAKINQFDDVVVHYKSPELLIFTISEYETSKSLCSQNWCIATSANHFRNYVDVFNNQYIIYDFTKKQADVRSVMGITINPDGDQKEAMFKNNHNYYYPNNTQPVGYSHTKQYSNGININDYLNELLEGKYELVPKTNEEVVAEMERRISNIPKDTLKETDSYVVYKIEGSDGIRNIISNFGGHGFGGGDEDYFFNFYLIFDKKGNGWKTVLGIKVAHNNEKTIVDVKGNKVDESILERF